MNEKERKQFEKVADYYLYHLELVDFCGKHGVYDDCSMYRDKADIVCDVVNLIWGREGLKALSDYVADAPLVIKAGF